MKKIFIYTTSTCPFCEATKRFLNERGYSYEEKNVENNEAYLKEMITKTGQYGVPVIEIVDDDFQRLIIGFRPDEIEEALRE